MSAWAAARDCGAMAMGERGGQAAQGNVKMDSGFRRNDGLYGFRLSLE
ncbi:hypothetical protein [Lysobacter enzymogenes]|nr:hypothetical protein [Lysobacter enzymogenes]